MEIITIVIIVIIGFVILAFGIGGGYWIYLATRTKKMTWKAKVYQLGDGEISHGGMILKELKPYTEDIIEKVDKKNGATHFWLQKLKKATPVVTADCVEVWSSNNKIVKVLLEEDTCTLLKDGYDKEIGGKIFRPMPHDRINMIKTEQAERKERIQDKKDILAAILPYVTVGIIAVALIIGIYVIVQGAVESSKNNLEGSIEIGNSVNSLSNAMLQIYGYSPQDLNNTDTREITKEDVPLPP